jgi:hypothetical protein
MCVSKKERVGYSREKPIGAAVAEGDECQRDKGRDGISDIRPVNLGDLANHHAADLEDVVSQQQTINKLQTDSPK